VKRGFSFSLLARRWWWSRWPLIRLGWATTRASSAGATNQTIVGLGIIAIGLALRLRRPRRIYSSVITSGDDIRIRVVQNGRIIGTG
jgi:hypothetical protein